MGYFSKLFIKEPFENLQLHMEKVVACHTQLQELFKILNEGKREEIEECARKVSEYEHDADLVKNEIRASMPKSFLFPIDRGIFLEILSRQDTLADLAEDIAELLTIKSFFIHKELEEDLYNYLNKAIDTTGNVKEIIFNFDGLLEASFGGPVAECTKQMIDQTAYKEHEADRLRKELTKKIFQISEELSTADFYLWMRIVEDIGAIAHCAEKLALRIGMLLDLQ